PWCGFVRNDVAFRALRQISRVLPALAPPTTSARHANAHRLAVPCRPYPRVSEEVLQPVFDFLGEFLYAGPADRESSRPGGHAAARRAICDVLRQSHDSGETRRLDGVHAAAD